MATSGKPHHCAWSCRTMVLAGSALVSTSQVEKVQRRFATQLGWSKCYNTFVKRFLTAPSIIRVGLGCVFLANSLTAFFAPGEFQDLVSGSFVAGLLPIPVASFVTCVGFNDLTVAILLFFGWRTRYVALYATGWLASVIAVIGVFSLDALEHLGFLAMSLALLMRGERH